MQRRNLSIRTETHPTRYAVSTCRDASISTPHCVISTPHRVKYNQMAIWASTHPRTLRGSRKAETREVWRGVSSVNLLFERSTPPPLSFVCEPWRGVARVNLPPSPDHTLT